MLWAVAGLLLTVVLTVLLLSRLVPPWWHAVQSGKKAAVPSAVRAALGGMILLDALIVAAHHPFVACALVLMFPMFIVWSRMVRMDGIRQARVNIFKLDCWPRTRTRCELLAADPWQLLVAVILSARTSDERVNQVMATLNEHLISAHAYATRPKRVGAIDSEGSLGRNKARFIVESARMVCSRFQ